MEGKEAKGGGVAQSCLLGGEVNNDKGVEEFVKVVSWQLRQSCEEADGVKDEELGHVWEAVDLCAR
jgi:hypothetical protein